MKKMKIMMLCACLCLFTGCYRVAVTVPGKQPSGLELEKTAPMFLMGMVGADVTAPCDAAIVETRRSFLDILIAGFTMGLYTPYSVTFNCAQAPQAWGSR